MIRDICSFMTKRFQGVIPIDDAATRGAEYERWSLILCDKLIKEGVGHGFPGQTCQSGFAATVSKAL